MKNQYVGDLNDYAKYQLLRICAKEFGQIIIVWMLTADDGGGDGGKIAYLDQDGWRACDPELFDGLRALVAAGRRNVEAIEAAGLLPRCRFISARVPTARDERAEYLDAVAETADSETMIFFDPDNGLEVASVPSYRRGAEKYLYLEELSPVAERGASLLIYQHFPRVQRLPYLEAALERLGNNLGTDYVTFAAHTSHVAFLFALTDPYARRVRTRLIAACEGSGLLTFQG